MTAADTDDEEKLDASALLQRLHDYDDDDDDDDVCVSSDQHSSQVIQDGVR